MFRWFSFAFVDRFVADLLKELTPLLPPSDGASTKVKQAAKQKQRYDMALKTLRHQVMEFAQREKLNFFQKARLSKQLQDGLIGLGQSAESAKEIAVRVVTELR